MLARLMPLALAACLCATAAFAQNAPPTRIRGTIAALEGQTLTINTREGPKVDVLLNDPLTVSTVKKVDLADIKPNTYVGIATRTVADGELQALEVLVFPEAMRGVGEGHYAWDLEPGSMMTNGTVTGDCAGDVRPRAQHVVQGQQQQDRRSGRRADRDLRAGGTG